MPAHRILGIPDSIGFRGIHMVGDRSFCATSRKGDSKVQLSGVFSG